MILSRCWQWAPISISKIRYKNCFLVLVYPILHLRVELQFLLGISFKISRFKEFVTVDINSFDFSFKNLFGVFKIKNKEFT